MSFRGAAWYGKRFFPSTVVGASGSSAARKSRKILAARLRFLKRASRACLICVQAISSPPPLPKMPPTSEAAATRSARFHGSGPCGREIAAYSPGIFVGSSLASVM